MTDSIATIFTKPMLKTNLPDFRPGDLIRVHQRIKDIVKIEKGKKIITQEKERVQAFEGTVIARKHGKEIGATFTVRNVLEGIGVERTFPLHSPLIEKIEVLQPRRARRAKLYYLRTKPEREIARKLKPRK